MKNLIITASIALGGITPVAANLEIKHDAKYPTPDSKSLTQAFKFTEKSDSYLKTKMNRSVSERVIKIIIDKLGVEVSEVVYEASFINDLGADSLDCVELVMELEKEFEISIPDEDAQKLHTVGDVIAYLEKQVQN